MAPSLSVIIPAYNESDRLGATLHTVLEYLNQNVDDAELFLVDDGSTDNTASEAEQIFRHAGSVNAHVIRYHPNRGKGYAVRLGLVAANAPIALFSDADLSTPITETPKLIGAIESDEIDLAFGSRSLDRSLIGIHQPWRREQGGRLFNLIVRLATGLPYSDTQCGFKAFRMSACRPVIQSATVDRFGFDVELLYVAQLAGLRLREIPLRWDHNEGALDASGRYALDSLRMLQEVRTIRQLARNGTYEKAISAVRLTARNMSQKASTDSASTGLTEAMS